MALYVTRVVGHLHVHGPSESGDIGMESTESMCCWLMASKRRCLTCGSPSRVRVGLHARKGVAPHETVVKLADCRFKAP